MKTTNVAASVRQRLLTLAQARGWEFNRVLARYGVERVLCRLAASSHAERFLLKGAMLFTVWEVAPHRATRDLDLLGLRQRSLDELVTLFREVIAVPVEPDGLVFGEVSAEPIRAAMEAGGIRMMGHAEAEAAGLPAGNRHRGETRGDGAAGNGQQPDEGFLRRLVFGEDLFL